MASIEISETDKEVLDNIASKNGLEIHEIVGLLMDGHLDYLVKANDWECDYVLNGGSPWKR